MSIVVGFVTTREGRAALRFAVQEAKRRGSDLVVINSQRGGHGPEETHVDAVLAEAKRELGEFGVKFITRALVREHDPAEDVVDVADEIGAECIVIGLRRRSPVGKLVMGSNAQRILLDATCPVISVKADPHD